MGVQFSTINKLWRWALDTVVKHGDNLESRNGNCREILGYSYTLLNVHCNFLTHPIRKLSPWYAAAELLWYLSGTNKIEMIKYYAPQYEKFSDDGVTAYGAYGHRWSTTQPLNDPTQIQKIIRLLKENSFSRRAIMTCYEANMDLGRESRDIPCTISLQFLIRDNKLHCICTMRSNDVWLGMPYDIWCFTCLQILIAQELGVQPGMYVHQPGSLHLYEKNYEKAKQCVKWHNNIIPVEFEWGRDGRRLELQIQEALEIEKRNRIMIRQCISFGESLLSQCALWCGIKDHKDWIEYVTNDSMATYMEDIYTERK